MQVWGSLGIGFGDLWAHLHFLLRKSEATGKPVFASRYVVNVETHDVGAMQAQMLALIDIPPGVSVIISDDKPNAQVNGDCWSVRYFPTKRRWSPEAASSRIVVYQFDGKSSAHIKNPSAVEVDEFLLWCISKRYLAIPVGLPLSMEQSVDFMTKAQCFVGCCSGMSVLACAVRVPTFVLEYELKVSWWYGSGVNPIVICPGVDSFIRAIETVT